MSFYTIAIHGGAGTILKEELTPALEREYCMALEEALHAGFTLLGKGAPALEAVRRATVVLEDNPLFNAGRGSVFNKEGYHEMDAAIMEGTTLHAGAVACVYNVRNPIELAYEVMRHSGHVFLSGKSAEAFARRQGVALEPDDYFFSEFRYRQWLAVRGSDAYLIDHSSTGAAPEDKKYGTVGAVARDQYGHLAAATSTGGMTNKQYGRIGDTPIIGAGTYANDTTCAISCTGHGELFIRSVAAYDVSCLMAYRGLLLQEAMDVVVNHKLVQMGGEGGMIGVDAAGNAALLFNSPGMYRGVKSSSGLHEIGIYQ